MYNEDRRNDIDEDSDIPSFSDIVYALNSLVSSFLDFYIVNENGEFGFLESYSLTEEDNDSITLFFDTAVSSDYDFSVSFSYRDFSSNEFDAKAFLNEEKKNEIIERVAEDIEVVSCDYWEDYYDNI